MVWNIIIRNKSDTMQISGISHLRLNVANRNTNMSGFTVADYRRIKISNTILEICIHKC